MVTVVFCFELNGFVCFGFLMGRNPFGKILIAGCKWTNYFGTPCTFIQAARIHIYKVMYVLAYSYKHVHAFYWAGSFVMF